MMTHSTQVAQQTERRWLSSLVGFLVIATVGMGTLQPTSLVSAAACLVNEETVAIQARSSWEAIISPIHGLPPTLAWDCYMNSVPFGLGKAGNPEISILTACPSPNGVKMARADRTPLTPVGKANSKRKALRMATLPYTSTKSVLVRRTPHPEIKRSTYYTYTPYTPAPTIIGPVQEFQSSALSSELNITQAIPVVPPIDTLSALFGDHLWGPLNQFQGLQRLPNGESHRMNMTTALALHGRDCVSDCP